MRVEIEYCGQWNYEPRARAAAGIIETAKPGVKVALVRGKGGVFDIRVDGTPVYSKHQTGRFPTDEEILEAVLRT